MTTPDDVLEELLGELAGWEVAYPLSAFPEPDLIQAAALLKAGGMTLDAVSASNMRHVVSCIVPKTIAVIDDLAREVIALRAEIARLRGEPIVYRKGFGPGDGDSAALTPTTGDKDGL